MFIAGKATFSPHFLRTQLKFNNMGLSSFHQPNPKLQSTFFYSDTCTMQKKCKDIFALS